ncbi:hypothetical protein T484DRAFT_1791826 [Baffinella frigidus]|nr:hypothetical protein T484DRAFT_1791826 [Cryptophyta sp. CCMP2293]
MSSAPAPIPASDVASNVTTDGIAVGGIAALFSAVERVACQKTAPACAAEGGAGGDVFNRKGSVPRTDEVHFQHTAASRSPPGASRAQAQQDNAGASRAQEQQDNEGGGTGDDDDATKLNASGFVDAVIPRRRGNEKKVVLTRALLESYHHESLDAVTERLGLSKTTIKAACRRLGLPKWPYQHTGPRKRRMGVPKQEQYSGDQSANDALKGTFHELMDKHQRVGEAQMAPNITLGLPLTSLPGSLSGPTMVDLQAIHMQSLSALSAMAATLNSTGQNFASGQNFALNGAFQGSAFQGSAFQGQALQGQALQGQVIQGQALQGQALPVAPPLLLGGNFGGAGGNYAGNYGGNYMPDVLGGFQQWGGLGGGSGFNLQ